MEETADLYSLLGDSVYGTVQYYKARGDDSSYQFYSEFLVEQLFDHYALLVDLNTVSGSQTVMDANYFILDIEEDPDFVPWARVDPQTIGDIEVSDGIINEISFKIICSFFMSNYFLDVPYWYTEGGMASRSVEPWLVCDVK